MEIQKTASAGSLESSDALITVSPNPELKIEVNITSPFIRQFGMSMKQVILATVNKLAITSCKIMVQDQGAIDEVLVARIITACHRACQAEFEKNSGANDE